MELTKYFTSKKLKELMPDVNLSDIKLQSSDSYNEEAIKESILKASDLGMLAVCALQTSIVGFGNKEYGLVGYKGSEHSVAEIYNAMGVNMKSDLNSKLDPGELTPRRLQRFFRVFVSEFIVKTGTPTYLWNKYNNSDKEYMHICFPGAEYMIEKKDEAQYLLNAYKELDSIKNIHLSTRVRRVLEARGFHNLD